MTVHATTVIEGDVDLPWDVEIGAYCVLVGPLRVGKGARIGPHVVIGTDGEHRSAKFSGIITIGENTIIREFSVIQRGTGERDTRVGARCLLMDHAHIAHDVCLDDDVTLSPNVTLGGHTRVHRGATIGIGAMTHQCTTIGAYSMIGMGSVVTRDVPPFILVMGNPARHIRENTKGIEAATRCALAAGSIDYHAAFLADSRRKIARRG